MKFFCTASLIFWLLWSSASLVSAQTSDSKDIKTDQFSLSVPASWETRILGESGVAFLALSPVGREGDAYRESLTVIAQNVAGTTQTTKSTLAQDKAKILSQFKDAIIVSESTASKTSTGYEYFTYTIPMNGVGLRYDARYYKSGDLIFTVLLSSEVAYFEANKRRLTKILDSFKF